MHQIKMQIIKLTFYILYFTSYEQSFRKKKKKKTFSSYGHLKQKYLLQEQMKWPVILHWEHKHTPVKAEGGRVLLYFTVICVNMLKKALFHQTRHPSLLCYSWSASFMKLLWYTLNIRVKCEIESMCDATQQRNRDKRHKINVV